MWTAIATPLGLLWLRLIMGMHHLFRRSSILATLFAVSCLLYGCIEVDDFGAYWNKGFVDTCVNDIVMQSMAEDSDEQDATKLNQTQLRSLKVGTQLFLMLRDKPQDKGGSMIRYTLLDGDYVSYRLDENKRKDFLAAHPKSPVVLTDETATIPVLNAESIALLKEIAGDESYWLETSREPYNPDNRKDCIKQAH